MFDRNAAKIHVVSGLEVPGPNESVDGCISIQLNVVCFAMDSFSTKSESPKLRKAEKGECLEAFIALPCASFSSTTRVVDRWECRQLLLPKRSQYWSRKKQAKCSLVLLAGCRSLGHCYMQVASFQCLRYPFPTCKYIANRVTLIVQTLNSICCKQGL